MWQDFISAYIKEIEHFVVASLFAIVNTLIRPVEASPWFYIIEFIISVTVATLIGFVATDLGFSASMSYSLTAVAALLARDILNLVIGFGDYVANNKETLFRRLFNAGIDKATGTTETVVVVDSDSKKE